MSKIQTLSTRRAGRVLLLGAAAAVVSFLLDPAAAGAGTPYAPLPRDPSVTARTLDRLAAPEWDVNAGTPRVWVYFTDKHVFDARAYRNALDLAASGLTGHAAFRRAKVLGPDRVDYTDLPVHPGYVARVEGLGAQVVRTSRWLNAVSVRAPLGSLHAIGELPFVRQLTLVGRGRPVRPDLPAAAPRFGSPSPQDGDPFDYGPSRDQMDEINVLAAHALGLSGAGVIVSMHDTGFYRDHEVFARLLAEGRLLDQYDFINDDAETDNEPGDDEGQHLHGTITWSLVGGFHQGDLVGAAYGASFLLAKTEDVTSETPVEEDNWVAAMEWADSLGADIISSSLAYIDWYTYEDMDGDTAPITIAADIAVGRGIVVCTAAGNYGTQDWYYIGAPADGDSVIAVGASRPDGLMLDSSSHGPTFDGRIKPEVVARGDETYAAAVPGSVFGDPLAMYHSFSGTSVSTPLVAGAAALMLEANPSLTPMALREALKLTADNAATPDNHRGWGRIDVLAAIEMTATDVAQGWPAALRSLVAEPNPFREGTRISLAGSSDPARARGEDPRIRIYSVEGRLVRELEAGTGGTGSQDPFFWDGRDAGGRLLPPGVYLLRLQANGGPEGEPAKVVLTR